MLSLLFCLHILLCIVHHLWQFGLRYFFEGHPSVAFSDGVTKEKDVKKEAIPDEYQTLYGKDEDLEHYFFPHVRAHGSGIDMLSACVKKKWFFYKAELGCY